MNGLGAIIQFLKEAAMSTLQTHQIHFDGLRSCQPRKGKPVIPGIGYAAFDRQQFSFLVEYEGWVHAMAGKQNKKAPAWGAMEFINVTLTEQQKDEFKSWSKKQSASIADDIGQVMVDDYRLSCNWDDNNQCFIATLTGKEDQDFNSGKALSARSDDWYEAIALALYKHMVIFDGKKWTGEGTKNNWG